MKLIVFLITLLAIAPGIKTVAVAATSLFTSTVCSTYRKNDVANVQSSGCDGTGANDPCFYCMACTAGTAQSSYAINQAGFAGITTNQLLDNEHWGCFVDANAAPKQYSVKFVDQAKKDKCPEVKRNWQGSDTTVCSIDNSKDFCQTCVTCPSGKTPTPKSFMKLQGNEVADLDTLCSVSNTPSPGTTNTGTSGATTVSTSTNTAATTAQKSASISMLTLSIVLSGLVMLI